MEKLDQYINGLIDEFKTLANIVRNKTATKHKSKVAKVPKKKSKTKNNIYTNSIPTGDYLSEIIHSTVHDSNVNIQAGNSININGNTIRTNGGSVSVVNGSVYVDGKRVREGGSMEVIELTVIIEGGSNVKSLSVEGNVTFKGNHGIIDNLMSQGNVVISGSRDVISFQNIKAEGNITISGNLEASKVNAGGNIVSSGKINWV